MTLEHAIEDHQASQVYKFHNIAKDTLAAMGRPLEDVMAEHGYKPRDWFVVNPEGHKIPRDIHIDPRARAASKATV